MHGGADFQTHCLSLFLPPTNCQCTQSACSEDWSTAAAAAGISAFNIMTLRGCRCSAIVSGSQSYEMSSGVWQDTKKQSPPSAPLNATFSYIVHSLQSRPFGWPVSLCDKTNYFSQELSSSRLSRGQSNCRRSCASEVIRLAAGFSCSLNKFGPRFVIKKVLIWFANLPWRRKMVQPLPLVSFHVWLAWR